MLEIFPIDQYFPNHRAIAMSYADHYRAARNLMKTRPFPNCGFVAKLPRAFDDFPSLEQAIPKETIA